MNVVTTCLPDRPCEPLLALRSPVNRMSYQYWKEKRGARAMPTRGDIDPAEIVKILPHVFLLDVRQEPLDFRYRLIGTALRRHMARDWTGMWLSTISFQAQGSAVWQNNVWVMENRAPLYAKPPYVGPHKDFMYVESVVLPLATDHDRVDMLMFFVDFIRRQPLPSA